MAYETHNAEETPEVVKATKARQGSWGRHILWVLIISTALAAIALLASFAFNAPSLQGEGGQTRTTDPVTATTQAPPPYTTP